MEEVDIRSFRHALRCFERMVVAQFKDSGCCQGVTLAQCHALMEVDSRGSLTLLELAQGLGLDKSTLSRTVNGLVDGGLVERKPHPRDRRSVLLLLTERGKQKCAHINQGNDTHFRRVFDRIAPDSRASVQAGFQALVKAMSEETDESCSR